MPQLGTAHRKMFSARSLSPTALKKKRRLITVLRPMTVLLLVLGSRAWYKKSSLTLLEELLKLLNYIFVL